MAKNPLKRKKSKRVQPNKFGRIIEPGVSLTEEGGLLFDRVAEDVIHENRDLFDTLTEVERTNVLNWLSDAMLDGETENAVHNVLWEIDYKAKPVGIEKFITDNHYLGRVTAGVDDTTGLHPLWVDDLKTVFAPGSRIMEWVFTGGIGIGKTTVAMVAMAYKLYTLSCLKDPPSYYGLLRDSLLIFGIYSITKRQVADTGYYKLRGWLDNSPYFKYDFPRSLKIDSKCDFKPTTDMNLQIIPGSQELHALGLDMYSFSMDEVNFMREKADKERGIIVGQAYDLYNAVHTRLLSRFMRPGGTIPGIMLLMSSRKAQTSFLEAHLKKTAGTGYTYVSDYALWETKPKHRFIMPWFKVEIGDRISASRLVTEDDTIRPGAKTVEIPGEYKRPFEEDLDQALRDIAGIATFNVSPLIRDRQSIFDAIRDTLTHPFTKGTITINYEDDVMIEEFYATKVACRIEEGKWVPRLNPGRRRFIHVDLSLSGDCAGFAMGHVSGITKSKKTQLDGTISLEENPFIIIDLMLRIAPPVGSEIDLSKIRAFVRYLSSMYPVTRVTFDGFQSADSIQILKKQRIETGLLSMDKSDEAYLNLRSAHFDRRIAMYKYDPYIQEVLDLERTLRSAVAMVRKAKVDHPTRATHGGKGSKDVTDAVAGVVHHCITDDRASHGAPLFDEETAQRVLDPAIQKLAEQEAAIKKHGPIKKVGRGRGKVSWRDLREEVKRGRKSPV